MACRTCRQSVWASVSARVRPPDARPDIVSADQFLLRTPGSRCRLTDMADLSSVRSAGHPPVQSDRPADGSGPGPDGGDQAADTSSAQRPTMRPVSWPRPTTRPARPGPERTGSNAHAPFGQPQPLPASAPVRRDTWTRARCRNVRKPGPRPMSARSCPASTMDTTIGQASGHRLPGHSRPDTVHSTRHALANRKRRGQGTDERHGRRSDILDRHTTRRPPGHAEPLPVGPALAAWQPRSARRWQDCQRDRNRGSDQALLGVALPSKPRLGALLSSDDCGSSVERASKLHPL
jgi:hypothetical protein